MSMSSVKNVKKRFEAFSPSSPTMPAAPEGAVSVSTDALLTALGGGYKLETRIQIVKGLLDKVDDSLYSLLAVHLEDIWAEARDLEKEKLAQEAKRLLKRLEPSEE